MRNEDIREGLRTTDPVAREPGLSMTEIQVMRRAIVAAGADRRHAGRLPWPLALAGTLAFAVVLAFFIGTVLVPVRPVSSPPPATEQRQLQFETPGGTRVVWVLNSQFDLPKDRQP